MAKITILGAGGFGVSLAIAAYQNQHQVTVWDISEEIVQAILRDGEHKTKLPGVKIPKGIGFTTDPHCMENSDMVVFVVPSLFIRSVAQRVKPFLTKDTILVNASKGLEEETFLTMSQIIQSEYPENAVGVITGPSHAEEVGRGVPTTVVAASKNEAAAGQTILLNGLEYTVSGVVDDVSGITADVYAEAWVTYSSLSVAMDHALGERDGAVGLLEANILLADASDLPALSEELRREVRRYNSGLSEGQVVCEEPLSYADNLLSGLFGPETYIVLGMALLLFLLVPALNLSGMNASRIQERVGELGIRKAFGATKATLMGQVFVENMVLMLPGGVAGLLFSYVLGFIFRNALLVPGFNLLGTSGDVFLSPGMLLNMSVFAYAFGVCVALNLLSSMLPAWRIVRGNITDALNG